MAGPDTAVGQGQSQFPPTAWSLVARLRDPRDPAVRAYLDQMAEAYWRPVYKFIRVAWKRPNEDAKDLTQSFFIHLFEGDLFARADAERGNFRKFLLAALRNFLANEARDARALKRGGGLKIVPLDDEAGDPPDPQSCYEAQWGRELLERSIGKLQSGVRDEVFKAFQRFHLDDLPVREIARELGTTEVQVAHFLQDARALLRRLVTAEVRQYVQDDSEVARELDTLFGGWR